MQAVLPGEYMINKVGFAVQIEGWTGEGRPAVVEGLSSGEMRAWHAAVTAIQPQSISQEQ